MKEELESFREGKSKTEFAALQSLPNKENLRRKIGKDATGPDKLLKQ